MVAELVGKLQAKSVTKRSRHSCKLCEAFELQCYKRAFCDPSPQAFLKKRAGFQHKVQKVSEYDQEIPQLHIADQPTAL